MDDDEREPLLNDGAQQELPPLEDRLSKWRRVKAERKERTADARAARERNAAEAQMLRARESEAWLQGHITRALAERDAHWREVHIEVLATQREDVDAKLAHLQLKIDALSAELNKQRAIQEGSIADLLPPVPQRKRNAAA